MIEMTVEYDALFGGGKASKTLYFHIFESQLISWYLSEGNADLPDRMREVVKNNDWAGIIRIFNQLIEKGYGERRGDDFVQSPELSAEFVGSPAYNALFMKLMTDPAEATKFFNGLFPPDLMARAQAAVEEQYGPGAKLDEVDFRPGATTENAASLPMTPERAVELSGLPHPYGRDHKLLPWAFREPTQKDLTEMTKPQMTEAMARKMAGWTPPDDV